MLKAKCHKCKQVFYVAEEKFADFDWDDVGVRVKERDYAEHNHRTKTGQWCPSKVVHKDE